MNAIERLRAMGADFQDVLSGPEIDRWMDDAAAVDALYQAAKEAAAPTTPDGPAAPFMWKPANDALAAAVRRIEGTP